MWQLTSTTIKTTGETADSKATAVMADARRAVAALKTRKDLGFWQLPERTELWTTSEARGREIRKTAHDLVVLGMGGSSLGGRALIQAPRKYIESNSSSVEFIDNVDSDRFWKFLRNRAADLQDTPLGDRMSKSGNTIETLTMAECIDSALALNVVSKN